MQTCLDVITSKFIIVGATHFAPWRWWWCNSLYMFSPHTNCAIHSCTYTLWSEYQRRRI